MGPEVVVGPVRDPDRLDPAEPAREALGVPAVTGVVGPLVGEVLAEAEAVGRDPDPAEELVGQGEVVRDVLVRHRARRNGLGHAHLDGRLLRLLLGIREERHPVVRVPREARVRLLLGVDEDLGLGLGELAQADHPLPGRDLVPVGLADLGRPEGEFVAVEPEQAAEVGEDPLRRLGPEVARPLRARPDHGLEHQREPEDLDLAELLAAGRAVQPFELAAEGRLVERGRVRAPTAALDHVVGPQVFAAVGALEHLVGEALDVARRDIDRLLPDGRALDLVEPLAHHVERAPRLLDPPLHHRAEGSVVDEPGDCAVALRGRPDEAPAPREVHHPLVYVRCHDRVSLHYVAALY